MATTWISPSTQSIVGKWQQNHDEHELKAFIDRYVSSSLLPVDDSGLRNLVTELQRHTQSASGEKTRNHAVSITHGPLLQELL